MATPAPEETRRAAREILERPEFEEPETDIWTEIARAISDPVGTLNRALEWLFSRSEISTGSSATAWIIVVIAALVIIAILVRLSQTLVRDDATAVNVAPDAGSVSWRELDEQADEAERSGDWRKALRLRYSAVISNLDEQGLVQRRPGRTTGEYLRQLKASAPDTGPSFTEATDIFDFVWYGDGEADEQTVERFKSLSRAATRMVKA